MQYVKKKKKKWFCSVSLFVAVWCIMWLHSVVVKKKAHNIVLCCAKNNKKRWSETCSCDFFSSQRCPIELCRTVNWSNEALTSSLVARRWSHHRDLIRGRLRKLQQLHWPITMPITWHLLTNTTHLLRGKIPPSRFQFTDIRGGFVHKRLWCTDSAKVRKDIMGKIILLQE